jgi:hypothetical protein
MNKPFLICHLSPPSATFFTSIMMAVYANSPNKGPVMAPEKSASALTWIFFASGCTFGLFMAICLLCILFAACIAFYRAGDLTYDNWDGLENLVATLRPCIFWILRILFLMATVMTVMGRWHEVPLMFKKSSPRRLLVRKDNSTQPTPSTLPRPKPIHRRLPRINVQEPQDPQVPKGPQTPETPREPESPESPEAATLQEADVEVVVVAVAKEEEETDEEIDLGSLSSLASTE